MTSPNTTGADAMPEAVRVLVTLDILERMVGELRDRDHDTVQLDVVRFPLPTDGDDDMADYEYQWITYHTGACV